MIYFERQWWWENNQFCKQISRTQKQWQIPMKSNASSGVKQCRSWLREGHVSQGTRLLKWYYFTICCSCHIRYMIYPTEEVFIIMFRCVSQGVSSTINWSVSSFWADIKPFKLMKSSKKYHFCTFFWIFQKFIVLNNTHQSYS